MSHEVYDVDDIQHRHDSVAVCPRGYYEIFKPYAHRFLDFARVGRT